MFQPEWAKRTVREDDETYNYVTPELVACQGINQRSSEKKSSRNSRRNRGKALEASSTNTVQHMYIQHASDVNKGIEFILNTYGTINLDGPGPAPASIPLQGETDRKGKGKAKVSIEELTRDVLDAMRAAGDRMAEEAVKKEAEDLALYAALSKEDAYGGGLQPIKILVLGEERPWTSITKKERSKSLQKDETKWESKLLERHWKGMTTMKSTSVNASSRIIMSSNRTPTTTQMSSLKSLSV